MSGWLRESLVYTAGAAAAFATDFALLWVLVEKAGLHYLVAASIAFIAGTFVVYWVSVRHAFRFRRMTDQRAEFGLFATIGATGIALNLFVMFALVDWAGLHYLLAKVGAAIITFFTNFGMRRWLLFTDHATTGAHTPVPTEHQR